MPSRLPHPSTTSVRPPMSSSPFLEMPHEQWIAANELAFAVLDGFPVSPGHTLVITKRLVATWFDATSEEQAAVMQLVSDVKSHLDETLNPKPTGYNVGFNAGESAGQTVMHLHVHVIPRYSGDMQCELGTLNIPWGTQATRQIPVSLDFPFITSRLLHSDLPSHCSQQASWD